MATIEELLQTLISVEVSSADSQSSSDSSISSQINSISSELVILRSGYIDTPNSIPNYIYSGMDSLLQSSGAYTSGQVQLNNTSYFKDIVAIKELFTYQFIFFGVVVGFFLVWAVVKGFFKNVSN